MSELSVKNLKLMAKYPTRIPCICNPVGFTMQKKKFLCPKDFTVSQFMAIVRRQCRMTADAALYCVINGEIPMACQTVQELYHMNKKDNQLIFQIIKEKTYGSCNL